MRIAQLISGGVDSSVALRLLQREGHDVRAFYLKIWLEDELSFLGECPWEEDLKYVRAVCGTAGVPLEVVPFQKEYWERVVAHTIDEVKAGRTPNPDMLCNARIKFGAFYDAVGKGFDTIATGHYAQVERWDGPRSSHPSFALGRPGVAAALSIPPSSAVQAETVPIQNRNGFTSDDENHSPLVLLKKSPDPVKDQTYFLSQLSQEQVARALFPIGHLQKTEVRVLAEEFALPNAKRKDSQGICFLGKIAFDKFLEYHLGKRRGDIIDAKSGKKLGEHDGFWYFTIGQRQGIKLSGGPWYVTAKRPETNEILVSNLFREGSQLRKEFSVDGMNWIAGVPKRRELTVKIRHGQRETPCRLILHRDGKATARLNEGEKGIAPGQFAVFYDGEYCLGGGVILE